LKLFFIIEEDAVSYKTIAQIFLLIAVLAFSFRAVTPARAYTCSSYVTVQWGDTLSGIAGLCGTTVDAIRAANPGLGWWLYAGQVLYIPNGSTGTYYPPAAGGTYVVQWGDTLASIAACYGISVNDLLAANPTIWNASWIYAGQVLNIPVVTPVYYTIQSGDTLKSIANYYGTTVWTLQSLNGITNANWIYAGQVIRVR
jgi:LysM repeat protein